MNTIVMDHEETLQTISKITQQDPLDYLCDLVELTVEWQKASLFQDKDKQTFCVAAVDRLGDIYSPCIDQLSSDLRYLNKLLSSRRRNLVMQANAYGKPIIPIRDLFADIEAGSVVS